MFWRRGVPDDPGYPWETPTLHVLGFPTPGMFVDLNERGVFSHWDGVDGLVRASLESAFLMAGRDPMLAHSKQSQFRKLRQACREMIVAAQWVDELYGCVNENYCGGVHPEKRGGHGAATVVDHVMNAKGRGINWQRRHAPNRERLEDGKAPQRATTLWGEPLPGVRVGARPLVWIPAVDLGALHGPDPTLQLLRWSDGTSTDLPPPCVAERGIENPVGLPGMPGFPG